MNYIYIDFEDLNNTKQEEIREMVRERMKETKSLSKEVVDEMESFGISEEDYLETKVDDVVRQRFFAQAEI